MAEGDGEFNVEDQVTFAEPADPGCADPTQRGKTWVVQKAHGMYSLGTYRHHLVSFSNECIFRLTTEILRAQYHRGCDLDQGMQAVDHGLWDHPAMDPNSCGVVNMFAPMGPWCQSEYSPSFSFTFTLLRY